jgi:hypothetical protein
LVSAYGPSVNTGSPSRAVTLHTAVAASRPPLLNTKTPAERISSITALPAAPFARSSSRVCSGTHSSLKLIR